MNFEDSESHGGWRPAPNRFLEIFSDPLYQLVLSLQDIVTVESAKFWRCRGIKAIHLPITTDTISSPMGLGSDSLPVHVNLFGRDTFLADSMQFMLEYGCRFNEAGTWYLMPSFRGEHSDKTHLNQFFHSEAELSGDLADVISVVEAYMRTLAGAVLNECAAALESLGKNTAHIERMAASAPFEQLTMDEAVHFLGSDGQAMEFHDGWTTLTRHGERRLMEEVGEFVWVTHFDHLAVPFYQAFDSSSTLKSLSADLLFGPGEVVGAGERHSTSDQLKAALRMHEVPVDRYQWYVDMKERSPMQTSGFGMGVERWMMWVLEESDIRELQLAPRLNGIRLTP